MIEEFNIELRFMAAMALFYVDLKGIVFKNNLKPSKLS